MSNDNNTAGNDRDCAAETSAPSSSETAESRITGDGTNPLLGGLEWVKGLLLKRKVCAVCKKTPCSKGIYCDSCNAEVAAYRQAFAVARVPFPERGKEMTLDQHKVSMRHSREKILNYQAELRRRDLTNSSAVLSS